MSRSWARRCAAALCGSILAALFAAVGVSAQESQPGAESGCENFRAGDEVDVVLLLDQSSSMGGDAIEEVRDGIGIVGGRLPELVDLGVEVRWAVVGFGSESLEAGRVLLPLTPISAGSQGLDEARSAYTANDLNTDYRSGLLGAREQLRGSTADCRLLFWFTDGQFDIGPDGKDSGDAPAVIEGVCASENALAQWFRDSNVRSYVILSNDWDIAKWERQFTSDGVLEASLSAMQAITGSRDVAGGADGEKEPKGEKEREISDLLTEREYEVNPACSPFTQDRTEVGEVLLNAGDLDDIFDVLMAQFFGDIFPIECPTPALRPTGEPGRFVVDSEPLPDGLLLDQIKIYNLNGEEDPVLSVFARPADGGERKPLRLNDKIIDSTQLQQFAARWTIEVEGPEDMEICISHPDPERVGAADVDVKLKDGYKASPEASQDASLFTVDLSDVPIIERAQSEGRSTETLLVDFGVGDGYREEWTASWGGGAAAELTFKPASPGTVEFIDLWIAIETGLSDSPSRVPLRGILIPTIEVTAPAGAPEIVCSDGTTGSGSREIQELGLNGGEVPKEGFVSSIECVVTPPEDDVAIVEFSLSETGNNSFEDLGFVFATSSGNFDPGHTEILGPGDAPLTFHLEIPEALDNRTWNTSGTFEVKVTWDRPGTGDRYKDTVTVEVPVDLLARSDTGFALLLTLLIAVLAVLVSLGLFRFMNSLVKIPGPDAFFARAADLKITNANSGAPRFEWADQDQLEKALVVNSLRPGRDLIADGVTLKRRVPPFFKPWKNTTTQATGFNTIRTSTAVGPREAPGSFSELILLATNDSPDEAGTLAARVIVLHPKPHPPEAPKLKIDIDRMLAQLVAQASSNSNPAPKGPVISNDPPGRTTNKTASELQERPPIGGGSVPSPPKRQATGGGGVSAPLPNQPDDGPETPNPPPPRRKI